MSKRKGSNINRQSKRHKGNDYYNDGKTDVQREMELFEKYEAQREQDQYYQAQQELQQSADNNNNINTNNNNNITSNIIDGSPLSDEEDDDDLDEDYNEGQNNIRDGDSGSDYEGNDNDEHDRDNNNQNNNMKNESLEKPNINNNNNNNRLNKNNICNEITLNDLRAVQMKRDQLEKICTEPYFGKFISRSVVPDPTNDEFEFELPGLFCRIYIGDRKTSSGGKEPIYRIGEMIRVEDYPRSYQLTDRRTTVNIGIVITHGSQERLFKIIQASNSPFTSSEFNIWKKQMFNDGQELPMKDDLSEAYLNAMKMHKNFKYTEKEIEILKKNKAKNYNAKNLANPYKEKLKIATMISGLADEEPEKHKLIIYLNDIQKEIERRTSIKSQAVKVSIASINEKNKIRNKELAKKAREKERKQEKARKGKKKTKDPFTRAITAPQIESFNKNINFDELDKLRKEKIKKEKEEQEKLDKLKKLKKKNKEIEDLKNLSILKDHKKRLIKQQQAKPLVSSGYNQEEGRLLINDNLLWKSSIHLIAKEFINNIDIDNNDDYDDYFNQDIDLMIKEPQFGRNRNKSKYGFKYTIKPEDVRVISIEEYIENQKYAAQ